MQDPLPKENNKQRSMVDLNINCRMVGSKKGLLTHQRQPKASEHLIRYRYMRMITGTPNIWPPLKILACFPAQGTPRKSSTLSPPLLMSHFRRCSETTIHLRTITIPLSNPSKFLESAKTTRRSSPIRPSSDDVLKPLSTYGQIPFRSAILQSLQENLLQVTLTPVATCLHAPIHVSEARAEKVTQHNVSPSNGCCRGHVDIRAVLDVQDIDGRFLAVGHHPMYVDNPN
ncbi:hypothetical protein DPMN_124800 [Dreissena polymorpha]|uniref:Uncharacterized protein n=1 Tax=Dreissena polymorpha TaxID=45954 RepID=A0A9D4GWP6_DREPO|nr:hypothetical protein DPMN_124800 [Dreissena polymorpha]